MDKPYPARSAPVSAIYQITNKVTGDHYIGSSSNAYIRWYVHHCELRHNRHHSPYLQNAWDFYGEEAFSFDVVEVCDASTLRDREQWYLDNRFGAYNTLRRVGGNGIARRRLNDAQVVEVFARYASGETLTSISEWASLGRPGIWKILRRQTYPDVVVPSDLVDRVATLLPARKHKPSPKSDRRFEDEQVVEIVERYETTDLSMATVGSEFGISASIVCQMVNRKIYKHVWETPPKWKTTAR